MRAYQRPTLEVADVFNRFSHRLGRLPVDSLKVVNAIKNCRTGALGGHRLKCGHCDFEKNAYNSCRNRHCPKCQFVARTKWIESREQDLLPCSYFHVVFTIPANLRDVFYFNKKICYNLLFKAAAETIRTVAKDKKHLGAEYGAIGVLHTWAQNLIDHPHVHFIVPGGGIAEDQKSWIACHKKFFAPVRVLSEVFRGKLLDELRGAHKDLEFTGKINHLNAPQNFDGLLSDTSSKNFVVYAKKPFKGPKQVIKYLGQYTHRIGLSNHRLVKVDDEKVYFRVRDPKKIGKKKIMGLAADEFMRRFLLHVLPRGFSRIRHYGFLSSRFKKAKIELIRRLLESLAVTKEKAESWKELVKRHTKIDVDLCPRCRIGRLMIMGELNPFWNSS